MLICPQDAAEPYLIPGHAYLFKTAMGWQEKQVWSEVIAYRLGVLFGLDVPPCFVAVDENTGETGALVEFFYGYPDDAEPARLVHASDLMTRILADKKKGRPHGVRTNLLLCRALRINDPIAWWGRTLTFDALIGNTDRHPDNWGFLIRRAKGIAPSARLAPIFDNGTSLGYEQPASKLAAMLEPRRLTTYVHRGTHHCGWDTTEDGPAAHGALCKRYIEAYTDAGPAMVSLIRFDATQVTGILEECTHFDVSTPFTVERAKFVSRLLEARRDMLRAAFGE